MTQTYCSRADIVSLMGEAALLASIDDNMDGVISAEEEAIVTSLIEMTASEINRQVRHQYVLTEVASNVWLKWAQATMCVYRLRKRRNNPAEGSVEDDYQEINRLLNEVRWGREQLPEQLPSFDHLPSVSNFVPQIGRGTAPIRVIEEESTTTRPTSSRKRFTADEPGYFW
jgi:hypothetical protein